MKEIIAYFVFSYRFNCTFWKVVYLEETKSRFLAKEKVACMLFFRVFSGINVRRAAENVANPEIQDLQLCTDYLFCLLGSKKGNRAWPVNYTKK